MPSNLVKTENDEKRWKRAKEAERESRSGGKTKWPVVTTIYENMKKSDSHEKTAAVSALTYAVMLRKQAYEGVGPTLSQQYRDSGATNYEKSLSNIPMDMPDGKGGVWGLRSMLTHPALKSNETSHVDASRNLKMPLGTAYMNLATRQNYENQYQKAHEDNPWTSAGAGVSPMLATLGGAGAGAAIGGILAGRKRRLLGMLLGGLGGGVLSYGLSAYLRSRMGGLEAPSLQGLSQLKKTTPALYEPYGALTPDAVAGMKAPPNAPRDMTRHPYARTDASGPRIDQSAK